MAERPCPTLHPVATTAPSPISAAPPIWRRNSRGSSQASQRNWPLIIDPRKAPASTPSTEPVPKFSATPDESMA